MTAGWFLLALAFVMKSQNRLDSSVRRGIQKALLENVKWIPLLRRWASRLCRNRRHCRATIACGPMRCAAVVFLALPLLARSQDTPKLEIAARYAYVN